MVVQPNRREAPVNPFPCPQPGAGGSACFQQETRGFPFNFPIPATAPGHCTLGTNSAGDTVCVQRARGDTELAPAASGISPGPEGLGAEPAPCPGRGGRDHGSLSRYRAELQIQSRLPALWCPEPQCLREGPGGEATSSVKQCWAFSGAPPPPRQRAVSSTIRADPEETQSPGWALHTLTSQMARHPSGHSENQDFGKKIG